MSKNPKYIKIMSDLESQIKSFKALPRISYTKKYKLKVLDD